MKTDTFANRLCTALKENKLKPIDLVNKTKIDRSAISNYLSGGYEPKNNNLLKIAKALNVNETWLMGYDVPKERVDPLLDKNDAILHQYIIGCSHGEIERELLVKCTMLEEYNQAKILEIVNMYLKEQGDFVDK